MKDSVDAVVLKGTIPPPLTAFRWMVYHLVFHGLSLLDKRQLVVRYEDVVRAPREQLARVAAYLDEELDDEAVAFVKPTSLWLATDHTAVGNDMRFLRGDVALAVDEEWRGALPARDRRIVTILTWPFLKCYRYVGRASSVS
jgi:hypothetical protein